jgi:hypothetical protein
MIHTEGKRERRERDIERERERERERESERERVVNRGNIATLQASVWRRQTLL